MAFFKQSAIFSFFVLSHSVVVSLWDVTEPLYIEILRSDGPQKRLADVDLTHLKSYWVIHTISIAALGHSKSLWAIYFVSSHPKSSWVIKTSYVRGPPIQNPIWWLPPHISPELVVQASKCWNWLAAESSAISASQACETKIWCIAYQKILNNYSLKKNKSIVFCCFSCLDLPREKFS